MTTINNISISDIRASVKALGTSVAKGLTFNGSEYKYKELLEVADSINADIISNVFAVTNMVARFTGVITIEDAVSGVMDGLSDKPSMGDIKVMFDNINAIFERQLELAEKYKNIRNIEALKAVCGGKSAFHYAYAGIHALHNKVVDTLGKHLPKVELKNQLLVNLSSAIHRVGEVLWSGVKLVFKALRMGVSMAAALVIQVGRVLVNAISSAVTFVMAQVAKAKAKRSAGDTEEVDPEALASAMADMQESLDNYVQSQPEEVKTKHVVVYQCATEEAFAHNQLAGIGMAGFTGLEEMVKVISCEVEGEDEDILNNCFYWGNNSEEWLKHMRYSLTVGDIVAINDVAYRCMADGWKCISK